MFDVLWRRRRRPTTVVFEREDGTPMSLWEVRAGLFIVGTDFALTGPAELIVRVRPVANIRDAIVTHGPSDPA